MIEFVVASSENMRRKAESDGGKFSFDRSKLTIPYRPSITKCLFDKLYFWAEHPQDSLVIFEEGQTSFNLHRPQTIARKRKVEGHRGEVLAATYLPQFEWVVTSGNDKMICFWDANFARIKKWQLDRVIGALCWCPEIHALYAADHFTEKIQAWYLPDRMCVRESEKPLKPDKALSFATGHTKEVQVFTWLSAFQFLATASLDTTVRIFDAVQMRRNHVLSGHTKGLTCLEYSEKQQLLLSGGFDNYIVLWDPSAGTRVHTFHGHECSITCIRAVPDTDYEIMSLDYDGVVKLWDVRRLKCFESFHAGDPQGEKAGEVEPLEPRTLCPLGSDRVVVSGRRMVLFEREKTDPHLSADTQITSMALCCRKSEIVTSVKTSLRIWSILTGDIVQTHDNVTESNITCMSLGAGERRLFVGSEDGQIIVLNYACGALCKTLTSHGAEVSHIRPMPDKVVTHSTADKMILIHDDTDTSKSIVLKKIDVSATGPMLGIMLNQHNSIVASSVEGGIFWYNIDSAKQVAGAFSHFNSATCCRYLESAPLVVTTDLDAHVIFWSVSPLRPYHVFADSEPQLLTKDELLRLGVQAVGITTMTFSADETCMYVGTDVGLVACINIEPQLEAARVKKEEVLAKKASGDGEQIMYGGANEDHDDTECDLEMVWVVKKAHNESIGDIIFYPGEPPVILTLGFDFTIRTWSHDTGECFGAFEQGLPGGVSYDRHKPWCVPIHAAEMLVLDSEGIMEVRDAVEEARAAAEEEQKAKPDTASTALTKSASMVQLPPITQRSGTADSLKDGSRSVKALMAASSSVPIIEAAPRYMLPCKSAMLGAQKNSVDWFAGNMASSKEHLPKLSSGLVRPTPANSTKVMLAAQRLSSALAD
eukprot:gnl/TRDRNA2_/TRDRNA2_189926_c0_seq1.p1 gnl/TRDRNA2_/TRDRNA2_189926_c0~~gnl/TRDRNA2_/TRDRNA2_189926_c0_seq1.p1  ORF type:complete len:1011 (+),score=168.18 gnl/TRDRNA2_/TRDRNA2_189926_c0_seq1:406-3033(+)